MSSISESVPVLNGFSQVARVTVDWSEDGTKWIALNLPTGHVELFTDMSDANRYAAIRGYLTYCV